jgi:hypothetical protein
MYARNDNGVRISNVSNAIVLTNTDKGYFYSSVKLEYPYKKGLWGLSLILIQVLMIYFLQVLLLRFLDWC